ncbi:nucleotidyl transferase AbiEii/AbiGii toxin family protein [Rhodoglobus aureus]|uniref:Nucleotidyl transferase AbiEii/AbiGii toxin family protein n=1 Tax=Rhodoglobus aureus TaxID=191497 RepID=A0ABN1VUX4_9MICO
MTNGASRFAHIQNQARAGGQNVSELARLYTLEGMLARIATSEYACDFVLKGGVLLAAFALRRPTKDIDLEATRINNDAQDVATRIREIAAISLDDGIEFDLGSIRAETIRDGDEYQGIRVKLTGMIGRSENVIGLDISFGDPIWPAPQRVILPRVLDKDQSAPISILGYPIVMIVAEKVVTMIQRGDANTRWRDFADVIAIANRHSIDETELREAMIVVASHRRATLETLIPALEGMPAIAQVKWSLWRTHQEQRDSIPELFSDALIRVAAFIDPVIDGLTLGRNWHPSVARWQ